MTADMLCPPRERELGPVLHAANYREARSKVLAAVEYLMHELGSDDDGGEHGDPSGNGGAGPTH